MTVDPYISPVLITFVLSLRPDQLGLGELVGNVEDVRFGEPHPLRNTADLVEFCRKAALMDAHGMSAAQ